MESQCRACLNVSTKYTELETPWNSEKSYLECFIECTQLQADLDDNLPHILCHICSTALMKAYTFIKEARKSDARLRNLIDKRLQGENENIAEKEIDNIELEALSEETKEEYLTDDDCADDYIEKDYSEDDADYLLEPSISNSQWACLECRRLLDGCVSYEGHMNMHKNLRPYKCLKCKTKRYRCQKALDRHKKLRDHNQEIEFETDAQNEKQEVQDTTEFIALSNCNYCNKMFESTEILHLHHLVYHNPKSNKICGLCNKNVKDHFDLNDHLCMEHPLDYTKLFKDLHDTFTNDEDCIEDDNDADIIEDDKTKENITKIEDFSNNTEFLELHAEEQHFLCAFCPRPFKNQKSLKRHEKIHYETTEDIVYLCTDCNRSYQTATLLEQHRRNSHKEREYNCNICGNAFKLKNQLKSHMKLHLEKNIQCPFCDKKYARRFDLNVHLRSHTGEMPYECHLCDKKFAIKVRLTYHLQKHYGIKHNCKERGAEFNSRQKLKAHSFKHTGMPYRCKICDDHGFPNRDVFKRHLLRVHHATISEEALLEMFQRNTGKSTRICEVNKI